MAKFQAEGVLVRRLSNLTITFRDAESIWVEAGNQTVIFHRWFCGRGSYMGQAGGEPHPVRWIDFRRRMLRRKNMELMDCFTMANYYGVMATSTARKLNLKGRKVIYKDE